jgi:hypothetical protein
MMVTGLHLPLKSLPLDGTLSKSQSTDSETIRPLSFGEILKLKEKQLQQDQGVSATSIAAALAALQNSPATLPVLLPTVGTGGETNNTTTQQTTSPRAQVQNTITIASTLTGTSTPVSANAVEVPELSSLAGSTNRVIPTELPAPVTETFSNTLAGNAPQQAAVQSQPSEKPAPAFATAQVSKLATQLIVRTQSPVSLTDLTSEVMNTTSRPAVKVAASLATPTRTISETSSKQVKTQSNKPVVTTQNIELRENTAQEPSVETPAATILVNAGNENVVPQNNTQTLPDTRVSISSSSVNSSPLQTETKDDNLQQIASSQSETSVVSPVQHSSVQPATNQETNLLTSEQVEGSVDPSTSKAETPDATQHASNRSITNQEKIYFTSKQVEGLSDPSSQIAESPDTTPVQHSSIQYATNQETIPLTSEQFDKSINAHSPKAKVPEPTHPASNQPVPNQEKISFAFEQADESVDTSSPKAEAPEPTHHASDQLITNHKKITFASQQADKRVDTSLQKADLPDAPPVQDSSVKPATNQESTPFTPEQVDESANASLPKAGGPDITHLASDRHLTDQAKISFVTKEVDIPAKIESSTPTSVHPSDVQVETNQITIPFVAEPVDKPKIITPLKVESPDAVSSQYSSSQSEIDGTMVINSSQQELKTSTINHPADVILSDSEGSLHRTNKTLSPQQPYSPHLSDFIRESDKIISNGKTSESLLATTEELNPEVKMPVSSLSSSPKEIETEIRPVVIQTVTKTDAPSMVSAQSTNNPSSIQTDIKQDDPIVETKTTEIRNGEMPGQGLVNQVSEKTLNSSESHEVEAPIQIPLTDAPESTPEMVARPQIEKDISEVSFPAKVSTTQPAMKSPLAQVEVKSTGLAGETTTEKIIEPLSTPKQTVHVVNNKGQSDYTKSSQGMPNRADATALDTNNFRATRKVAPQIETPVEATTAPQIQGSPEIMQAITVNDTEVLRFGVEQSEEINVTSTLQGSGFTATDNEIVDKSSISTKSIASSDGKTGKFVTSTTVHSDTPIMDSTRPMPDATPSKVPLEQVKIEKQNVAIPARAEGPQPSAQKVDAQNNAVATNSIRVNNETMKDASRTVDTGVSNPVPVETIQPEIYKQSVKMKAETIEEQPVASTQVRENTQAVTIKAGLSAESIATPSDDETEKLGTTTIQSEDMPTATSNQSDSNVLPRTVMANHDVDSKKVETSTPRANKAASVAEVTQSDINLPAVAEDGATVIHASKETVQAKTQTGDHVGTEARIPEKQATVKDIPAQVNVEQETVVVESEAATPQIGKMAAPVNETRSAQPAIVVKDTSDGAETVVRQPVARIDASQTTPLQATSKFSEATIPVETKTIRSEIGSEDVQVETPAPMVELPQSAVAVPVSSAESTQVAKDNSEVATASQAPISFDMPEPQSFEPKAKSIEHQDGGAQVNVEAMATVPAQNSNKSVEEAEVVTVASANVDDIQNEIPVAPVEKSDHARPVHTNKSETVDSIADVSVPSAENKEIPVPSQPAISVKAKSEKELSETRQVDSTDEKLRPVDKQPKLKQTPDLTVATTGPGKEATVIESSGKMPINQANVQATEIIQQVIRQMNVKIKNGPTSMHLQLNPKDLGAIDVEMVSSSQGVHVTFFAEQAGTGKLLESQLTQLRDSLVDSGVQLSGLNISQHDQSGQKGGSFNQDANFVRYLEREVTQTETLVEEPVRTKGITGQTSGEIDYRI